MRLRWPPLWRLLLPALVFLALVAYALITETALGYRTRVRAGPTGWRLIPHCASPFEYWSNVVLCLEWSVFFACGALLRHRGLEAWLRNRPALWAGLLLIAFVLTLCLAFAAAAVLP